MGKFSLGKKGDDGDEDSGRLALFGSRSKTKSQSPAPAASNPYAQAAIPADPYTQAKMNAGLVRPPADSGAHQPPQSGYGAPRMGQQGPSGYGRSNGGFAPSQGGYTGNGYGADRYGGQNGYGGDAYASQAGGGSRGNPGGYGGLGQVNTYDSTASDPNREDLFGGARERLQKKQQESTTPGGPPDYEYNPSDSGGAPERSYGAYGDRQLTAEEEEEEDVQATKEQIKFMKQQDVSSTRNALRLAAQAEETGRNTLARLGAQGERIHNTERNLDIAANHTRLAEDKAKEIKTLNRSMFAVHVSNPFTSGQRRERREAEIIERHQTEREEREASREAAFQSTARMNSNFRGLDNASSGKPRSGPSLAERAKYQFEADSEDDAMEDEIDNNLDELSDAAKRLNMLARATGEEVEAQNAHLPQIAEKSDRIDDQLHLQTQRLKRIR